MSIFHKTISDAVKVLDIADKGNISKYEVRDEIAEILVEHMKALDRAFAQEKNIHELLNDYSQHLRKTIQLFNEPHEPSNPWWIKV